MFKHQKKNGSVGMDYRKQQYLLEKKKKDFIDKHKKKTSDFLYDLLKKKISNKDLEEYINVHNINFINYAVEYKNDVCFEFLFNNHPKTYISTPLSLAIENGYSTNIILKIMDLTHNDLFDKFDVNKWLDIFIKKIYSNWESLPQYCYIIINLLKRNISLRYSNIFKMRRDYLSLNKYLNLFLPSYNLKLGEFTNVYENKYVYTLLLLCGKLCHPYSKKTFVNTIYYNDLLQLALHYIFSNKISEFQNLYNHNTLLMIDATLVENTYMQSDINKTYIQIYLNYYLNPSNREHFFQHYRWHNKKLNNLIYDEVKKLHSLSQTIISFSKFNKCPEEIYNNLLLKNITPPNVDQYITYFEKNDNNKDKNLLIDSLIDKWDVSHIFRIFQSKITVGLHKMHINKVFENDWKTIPQYQLLDLLVSIYPYINNNKILEFINNYKIDIYEIFNKINVDFEIIKEYIKEINGINLIITITYKYCFSYNNCTTNYNRFEYLNFLIKNYSQNYQVKLLLIDNITQIIKIDMDLGFEYALNNVDIDEKWIVVNFSLITLIEYIIYSINGNNEKQLIKYLHRAISLSKKLPKIAFKRIINAGISESTIKFLLSTGIINNINIDDLYSNDTWAISVEVNPNNVLNAIDQNRNTLNRKWKIKYINQLGEDHGGIIKDFYYLLGTKMKEYFSIKSNYYYINENTKNDTDLWFKLGNIFAKLLVIDKLPCGINLHPYLLYRLVNPEFETTKLISFDTYWYKDDEVLTSIHKILSFSQETYEEFLSDYDENIEKYKDNKLLYCTKLILETYEKDYQPALNEFLNGFWLLGDSTRLKYLDPLYIGTKIQGNISYNIDNDNDNNSLKNALNLTRYGSSNQRILTILLKVLSDINTNNREKITKLFRFWFGSPYVDFSQVKPSVSFSDRQINTLESHTCSNLISLPLYDKYSRLDDDSLYKSLNEMIDNTIYNQDLAEQNNLHTQLV